MLLKKAGKPQSFANVKKPTDLFKLTYNYPIIETRKREIKAMNKLQKANKIEEKESQRDDSDKITECCKDEHHHEHCAPMEQMDGPNESFKHRRQVSSDVKSGVRGLPPLIPNLFNLQPSKNTMLHPTGFIK